MRTRSDCQLASRLVVPTGVLSGLFHQGRLGTVPIRGNLATLCTQGLARGLLVVTAIVVVMGSFVGCGGEPEPVGRLSIEPGVIELAYPSFQRLQLRFEPAAALVGLKGRAHVFVHVLDRPGHVLRTFDHQLPHAWRAGDPFDYDIELYQSVLGEPLEPGSYLLSLGLYDEVSGRRWHLETAGEEIARAEYRLGTIEVPDDGSQGMNPRFVGSWLPPLAGADLQVLGRRCLLGRAGIELGELAEAGRLLLEIRLPEWTEKVSDDAVSVTVSCDNPLETVGSDASLVITGSQGMGVARGTGAHRLIFETSGPAAGQACSVDIEPAYAAPAELEDGEPLACLQILAWQSVSSAGAGAADDASDHGAAAAAASAGAGAGAGAGAEASASESVS